MGELRRRDVRDYTDIEYYIVANGMYVKDARIVMNRDKEYFMESFELTRNRELANLFVNDSEDKTEDITFVYHQLVKAGLKDIGVFELKRVVVNTSRQVLIAPEINQSLVLKEMTPEYIEKLQKNLGKVDGQIKVSDEEIQLRVTKDINDSYNG